MTPSPRSLGGADAEVDSVIPVQVAAGTFPLNAKIRAAARLGDRIPDSSGTRFVGRMPPLQLRRYACRGGSPPLTRGQCRPVQVILICIGTHCPPVLPQQRCGFDGHHFDL